MILSFRTERSAVKNLVYIHVYASEILPPYGRLDDNLRKLEYNNKKKEGMSIDTPSFFYH